MFSNDVRLARLLAPASPDKIGSSIATTIEGAVKFQAVKMLFEQVVRLMPQIPFLRGLNEKIQGAAVRHHLRNTPLLWRFLHRPTLREVLAWHVWRDFTKLLNKFVWRF
ncbi:hypothetical protein BKN38_03040 [Helicobacter sp. CLO-3]|uniref:hypothetical protein n=1 Tax=unclassified Helicobacter TaxID=2593540 RepID=UPI0008DAEB57|nr:MULTISPECIES: hypothetical protein [unclassified Helicobacter]OHU84443.1 hypothetical protein BKN38_03040 [Helicobacter sp. CLO-3]